MFMQEINKYPYKAQGRKMKVLIETIAPRRGYKNFADEAEFDDFLAQNYNKITGYQILQEDDDGLNEQLQNVAKQCEMLENHLIQLFFTKADQHSDYNKLLYAAGRLCEAVSAIKSCIK